MHTRSAGPLGTYRREHTRTEAHNWNTRQRRNPDPATTVLGEVRRCTERACAARVRRSGG